MTFVVWWAIPLVATIVAVVWLSWRNRPRPGDPHDTVAQRERFNEAMETGPIRRPRRSRSRPVESTDPADGIRPSTGPDGADPSTGADGAVAPDPPEQNA